jgi:hypothetical protein
MVCDFSSTRLWYRLDNTPFVRECLWQYFSSILSAKTTTFLISTVKSLRAGTASTGLDIKDDSKTPQDLVAATSKVARNASSKLSPSSSHNTDCSVARSAWHGWIW